jgi:hypothetical protein
MRTARATGVFMHAATAYWYAGLLIFAGLMLFTVLNETAARIKARRRRQPWWRR